MTTETSPALSHPTSTNRCCQSLTPPPSHDVSFSLHTHMLPNFCLQSRHAGAFQHLLLQHIHIQYSLTYRLSVLYPVAVVPLVVPEPEGGEDVVSRFSYRGDGGETPHGVISALHRQEVNWTVARTEKARKRDDLQYLIRGVLREG